MTIYDISLSRLSAAITRVKPKYWYGKTGQNIEYGMYRSEAHNALDASSMLAFFIDDHHRRQAYLHTSDFQTLVIVPFLGRSFSESGSTCYALPQVGLV